MYFLNNHKRTLVSFLILLFLLLNNYTAYTKDQNNEHALKGWEYFKENKFDEAISELTNAIEVDPKLTGVYIMRGLSYIFKGDNISLLCEIYDMRCDFDHLHGLKEQYTKTQLLRWHQCEETARNAYKEILLSENELDTFAKDISITQYWNQHKE